MNLVAPPLPSHREIRRHVRANLREAVLHLARYRAAFPQDYEKWRAAQRGAAPAAN